MKQILNYLKHLRPATRSLGIEITDSCIKAVEMSPDGQGGFMLLGCVTEPLSDGAVDDGRIHEMFSVIRSMQTAVAKLNPKTKRVHMVAPSQSVMVRFLKLPDIPIKDLKKLVDFEVKHNIHLPFDQPVYDFVKLNEAGPAALKAIKAAAKHKQRAAESNNWLRETAAAKEEDLGFASKAELLFDTVETEMSDPAETLQCDVMLVASPAELIKEYTEIATAAGLKLQSLEIKALSLFRLIIETEIAAAAGTWIALDVNSKASDVSIFHEGALKITRSLPLVFEDNTAGGHPKETDGQDALFAEFESARRTAETAGVDLAHELERLMNFYRYTLDNRNQVFDRILLSGDISFLAELAGLLAERLGLRVDIIGTERIAQPDAQPFSLPGYAVAAGLALRGNQ